MNFSEALINIKAGVALRRSGWNGPDQYIQIQFPDAHSKMTVPYIYIRTQQSDLVPWLASQGDLMANDWELIN